MENLKMPYSEVKHMLVIIGRNNDFIGRNNDNVILKERKISDLTLFNMISFEKINFCALIG